MIGISRKAATGQVNMIELNFKRKLNILKEMNGTLIAEISCK